MRLSWKAVSKKLRYFLCQTHCHSAHGNARSYRPSSQSLNGHDVNGGTVAAERRPQHSYLRRLLPFGGKPGIVQRIANRWNATGEPFAVTIYQTYRLDVTRVRILIPINHRIDENQVAGASRTDLKLDLNTFNRINTQSWRCDRATSKCTVWVSFPTLEFWPAQFQVPEFIITCLIINIIVVRVRKSIITYSSIKSIIRNGCICVHATQCSTSR